MKKILAIIALALPLVMTSCLKDEVYGGVNFNSLSNTDAFSQLDEVTVTTEISSLVDITSVTLYYSAAGADYQAVTMTSQGDGTYTATIPGYAVDTEVSYYVEAETSSMTCYSNVASYTVGVATPVYTNLRLNELNGNDKFIEIYNSGTFSVPLKDCYIVKDGEKIVWTCPDGYYLGSDEYLLLYSEDVKDDHKDHDSNLFFSSGLSAKKAVQVQLFDPSGKSISNFNYVTYSGTKAKASYGINSDGLWYYQDTATPGAENVDGTVAVTGLE